MSEPKLPETLACGHEKIFFVEGWMCALCARIEAVKDEQNRCMNVALYQYAYWRGCEIEGIQDFASGAMGASTNIVCAILGIMPIMKREDKVKT